MTQTSIWGYVKPFLVGSLSGSMASTVIQPIDTIKVIIQNKRQSAGKTIVDLNPFKVGRQIIDRNGVIGLYKGLDSAILRQFIYCGIRLGMYKAIEDKVKEVKKRGFDFKEKVFYSLMTGAIGSAIANPTDVALIRFQADNNLPSEQRRNYKHVFDALGRIHKQEGVAGLWRGSIPTIMRAMSLNMSHLVSYNQSKEILMKYLNQTKETNTVRFICSAISGVSVCLFVLPFDNVKTKIIRMKANEKGELPYKGFLDCFAKSIRNEGVLGLWVGIGTFYMRIAPHAMITLLAQDFLHDILPSDKA